jgi:uncharacterized membrane protein
MNFIKTTILGGLVFLVPVVALVVVLAKVYEVMLTVAEPMADVIPIEVIGGVAIANIIAALIVLSICFIAGLIARAEPARRLTQRIEDALLHKIPGYAFVKGMTRSLSPEEAGSMPAVLVSLGYSSRVGLEVEKADAERVVVYFPGSPNAWSGEVRIVENDQVQQLDEPMGAVIEHAVQLGRGSHAMLARSP